MRIAAGILLIIVFIINLIAGGGYLLGGGVASAASQAKTSDSAQAGELAIKADDAKKLAGLGCCGQALAQGIDDVGFIATLIATLIDSVATRRCIDADRVYATGMSNGGYMSHRLACQLTDRLAASAPVAGVEIVQGCAPTRPIPVLQIHGTADTVVPFANAQSTVAAWRTRNGCPGAKTVIFDGGGTTCERYDGCTAGTEVIFCSVAGGAHVWPGGAGSPSALNATSQIIGFFERHRRGS
jgi:polyhydroxybutyrate depolymerase